ncbi:MAG: Ig-like domain-containing protein, partial [Candidatus Pacearchaeota archaeon]
TTAPSITGLVPGDKTISLGQTVTFSVTATDANTVADVKLYNNVGVAIGSFAHQAGNLWNYTSTAYNTKGNYQYYIVATDSVGNQKREPLTTGYYTITVNDLIWDLSSPSGWNLVSVPKTLTVNSKSSLLPSNVVWSYNSGSWINPSTITSGVGYWVNNAPLTSKGLDYATQTSNQTLPSETITLRQGWNLIGHMCINTQDVSVAFPTSIYNNLFVLRYNKTTDSFQIYATQNTGSAQFTQMTPGEGYWVFVPSGDLVYTNIC